VALGIILNVISGLPVVQGIIISAIIVSAYTFLGGLWAISVTDFMQTIIIIVGLSILAITLVSEVGDLKTVIAKAPEGFFKFLPEPEPGEILHYFAAWITIGLGSIPQQDVFQRIMSARSEKVAVRSSFLASAMYLTIACLPLLIALCSRILFPELLEGDEQLILPQVVLLHTNLGIQVLFFGALLSAIMSTTSAAILAPASVLAENLIKPLFGKNIGIKRHLLLLRLCVIFIAFLSTILATFSSNIYHLVGESSALSLVSLFVPMIAGLYWKKATSTGAVLSMICGLGTWIIFENFQVDIPSLVPGLILSAAAMYFGSILSKK
jgi:Na+/proline symporter